MYPQSGYGGQPPPPSKGIDQLSFLLGLAASLLLSPIINDWLDATSLHEFLIAKYSEWAWIVEGGLKLIVFGVVFATCRAFISLSLTALMLWGIQRLPAWA